MTTDRSSVSFDSDFEALRRAALDSADAIIPLALAEDLGDGDRTSRWTIPAGAGGSAGLVARAPGVICGVAMATSVFATVDPDVAVVPRVSDGSSVASGDLVLEASGPMHGILAAERTALNCLARLSGIATLTSLYVREIEGTGCRIADTRKTAPGWRLLDKYAARCGGAMSHRAGLFDMVLIKENHIRAAGGVDRALQAALPPARAAGIEVEIEVTSITELRAALAHSPDRIMLDNMDPAELTAAVQLVRARRPPHPLLEASGGVTLESARRVAESGVDYISVGAITHSAPALDLSLLVTGE